MKTHVFTAKTRKQLEKLLDDFVSAQGDRPYENLPLALPLLGPASMSEYKKFTIRYWQDALTGRVRYGTAVKFQPAPKNCLTCGFKADYLPDHEYYFQCMIEPRPLYAKLYTISGPLLIDRKKFEDKENSVHHTTLRDCPTWKPIDGSAK